MLFVNRKKIIGKIEKMTTPLPPLNDFLHLQLKNMRSPSQVIVLHLLRNNRVVLRRLHLPVAIKQLLDLLPLVIQEADHHHLHLHRNL